MTTTIKLKWLLALVMIFGGFTVYKIFEGLVHNPAYQEYEWVFKIISEFGLFISVIVFGRLFSSLVYRCGRA